ncbi:785_t:CDS:2, partial [Racocetra fulgida]
MLTTWDVDDLKKVAAIFNHSQIKIVGIKIGQLFLHEHIAKEGLVEQVEKIVDLAEIALSLAELNYKL